MARRSAPHAVVRAAAYACAALLVLAACSRTPPEHPVHITPMTLAPSTRTPTPVTDADWTMYHDDAARSGYLAAMPDPTRLTRSWMAQLDGAVYAEPLVVSGRVIAATEHDSLYALDARTGTILWHTNVGTPVPLSDLPCGNIDPLGITGTPVYDPQTGLVFAGAEISGPAHMLVGVDVANGQVKVRRSADIPGMDPQVHQERAALAFAGGRVYIAYGGLDGDCGNYRGTVVASRTDGTGPLLSFQIPTPREGGIWATPGPAIDAEGSLYIAVGNGAATGGTWDHSDSVLRLSQTLQLKDGFAPQDWGSQNAGDADLGSMGPVLLPGGYIFADGKAGTGYLMRADHLGGVSGQIQTIGLCDAFGGAAVSGSVAFIPCTSGLRQIMLAGGRIVPGWRASQVNGSPVIGGHTVYSLDVSSGTLYALDANTGAVRATVSVGTASRFATPSLSQGRVFVGTFRGITAVSIA
jgi:YVTN family beta-propeller protein